MKFFGIWALVALFMITVQATNAGFDDLVLDGIITEETVDFSIKNTGTSILRVNFIVIQDNVLIRGQINLNPGEIKTVTARKNPASTEPYVLQVTEIIFPEGTYGTTKTHVLQ